MPSSLADKIRKHRREKGYSLDKLAELTDSSKSYLWELENRDTRKPSGEKLTQLTSSRCPRRNGTWSRLATEAR
jgi:transcriptional regulator with XRE-family HTH domain